MLMKCLNSLTDLQS